MSLAFLPPSLLSDILAFCIAALPDHQDAWHLRLVDRTIFDGLGASVCADYTRLFQ